MKPSREPVPYLTASQAPNWMFLIHKLIKQREIAKAISSFPVYFGSSQLRAHYLETDFVGCVRFDWPFSYFISFQFVETFIIEANPTLYPRLQFSLYDLANFTSKDLRKHDYIGCVEIQLEHLLEQEYPVVRTLRIPGDVKSRGFIHIYVEEVVQSKTNVRLHFGGQHIEKNGFLGRNDSFFEVCRPLHGGHFHPVYRSEVVTRTNDPK